MVFYRKYRPQIIEDLDSLDIREKLYSVLSSSSVSHAFLFTGPKGLGKTSTARILAKAINCEKISNLKSQISKPSRRISFVRDPEWKLPSGQLKSKKLETKDQSPKTNDQIEPCNECTQCTSITNGTNMDVLEIDAASNRGIDEIRDLRDKIRLAPISANKKVYIIDEVHMLTTEAFNALLKTLEEPPPHAVFILCTTEMHKLPETILSRCVHIAFKKATDEELSRSFKRIAKSEKVEIEEEALKFIASLSDGSFRDGVKLLEELVSLSKGGKITKKLIENKYQISNLKSQISKMLEALVEKNTKEALVLISKLVEQGVDIKYFMEQLINQLHNLLLDKAGIKNQEIENGKSMENEKWKMEDIKKLIVLLSSAHGELKYAVLPQLPLELAVIEWGDLHPTQNNTEPNTKQHRIEKDSSKQKMEEDVLQRSSALGSASFSDKKVQESKKDGDDNLWQELINKVKLENHSIAGVLRGCSLKNFDKKTLIIEAGYKFHKEKLEERKSLEVIEKVVEEIVGQKVVVSIILKTSN